MKTVLIAENDKKALRMASSFFKHSSFKVMYASNGSRALGIIQDSKPDVAILDIEMPIMGGEEVCRRIKLDSRFNGVFTILTSRIRPVGNPLPANSNRFLRKPWDFGELTNLISGYFRQPIPKELLS